MTGLLHGMTTVEVYVIAMGFLAIIAIMVDAYTSHITHKWEASSWKVFVLNLISFCAVLCVIGAAGAVIAWSFRTP